MGMLGTVTGMIASFDGLSQGGVNNEAVALGISEALITTAGGLGSLLAVIPNYFNSKSDAVDLEIEGEGAIRRHRGQGPLSERPSNDGTTGSETWQREGAGQFLLMPSRTLRS